MEILKVADIVKELLISNPKTKDDDELLTLKVWAKQNPKLRVKNFSFKEFSDGFLKGEYYKTESIRRTRQKLQQEFPHLRGKVYESRHNHQNKVKEDLRTPEINAGGTP
jgi:hypothetical protein